MPSPQPPHPAPQALRGGGDGGSVVKKGPPPIPKNAPGPIKGEGDLQPAPPVPALNWKDREPAIPGSIFLIIAAYREQRGARGIASAFANAAHPEKLYVGLFQQVSRHANVRS